MTGISRWIEGFIPASMRPAPVMPSQLVLLETPDARLSASDYTTSKLRYRHAPLKTRTSFRLLRLRRTREAKGDIDGAQAFSHIIYVEGRPSPITANLALALRNSQRAARTSLLWVDAICINQEDPEERSQQVQQMRSIFSNAKHVIAFLGEEMDGSQHIPNLCRMIINSAIRWRQSNPLSDAPRKNTIFPDQFEGVGLPPNGNRAWTTISEFLARPWFLRVWIIQEAVCARKLTFVCGSWTMDRGMLLYAVQLGGVHALPLCGGSISKFAEARNGRTNIELIFELLSGSLASDRKSLVPSLLDVARRSKHQKATDPRDNIYALLGLSNEDSVPGLQPDYTEPVADTFHRFATYFVNIGEGARLLIEAAHRPGSDLELPSWVPDWSVHDKDINYIPPPDYRDYFSTIPPQNGRISTGASFKQCGNRLSVAVYLVDVIERTGSAYLRPSNLAKLCTSNLDKEMERKEGSEALQEMAECIEEIGQMLNTRETYPTGESKAEVFCWTILCNKTLGTNPAPNDYDKTLNTRLPPDDYEHRREPFRALLLLTILFRPSTLNTLHQLRINPLPPPSPHTHHTAMIFLLKAQATLASMRRCLTTKGYLGQVPPAAQTGDAICLLAGEQVPPLLLRPRARGEYSLVGQCYLHGFMKGEVPPGYRQQQDIAII
ncbi:MAG: hypothetical protein M1840_005242 [Geoglossum simile]|nr:MAG: hypothetical protein M1840_005242 [Geoglossum simile]